MTCWTSMTTPWRTLRISWRGPLPPGKPKRIHEPRPWDPQRAGGQGRPWMQPLPAAVGPPGRRSSAAPRALSPARARAHAAKLPPGWLPSPHPQATGASPLAASPMAASPMGASPPEPSPQGPRRGPSTQGPRPWGAPPSPTPCPLVPAVVPAHGCGTRSSSRLQSEASGQPSGSASTRRCRANCHQPRPQQKGQPKLQRHRSLSPRPPESSTRRLRSWATWTRTLVVWHTRASTSQLSPCATSRTTIWSLQGPACRRCGSCWWRTTSQS
mmetsp:Transcript_114283/g.198699  ORF Transcript_114283/g.198699 Transcript_114283/m.198699 type:complete len:270 (+) Transcript_114283:174-983(+)